MVTLPARANLLSELLDYFGGVSRSGPATDSPPEQRALLGEIQTYPNPFNPALRIEFELGRRVRTKLDLYNLRGEWITTLVDEELGPGPQRWVWDGTDARGAAVASGVYLYRMQVENQTRTGKVALIE